MITPFNPTRQNEHLADKIAVALERIAEAFRVMLWNQSKESGLSPIQSQILIFLAFHKSQHAKVSYLATEFNLTKPTISDSVKVLAQKGLVTRQVDPEDSRSQSLHLTEEGLRIAHQSAHFANQLASHLHKFQAPQQNEFYSYLISLISHLQQSGIISTQRMCYSCSFYQLNPEGPYCQLLRAPLKEQDIRIDCPEHIPVPV